MRPIWLAGCLALAAIVSADRAMAQSSAWVGPSENGQPTGYAAGSTTTPRKTIAPPRAGQSGPYWTPSNLRVVGAEQADDGTTTNPTVAAGWTAPVRQPRAQQQSPQAVPKLMSANDREADAGQTVVEAPSGKASSDEPPPPTQPVLRRASSPAATKQLSPAAAPAEPRASAKPALAQRRRPDPLPEETASKLSFSGPVASDAQQVSGEESQPVADEPRPIAQQIIAKQSLLPEAARYNPPEPPPVSHSAFREVLKRLDAAEQELKRLRNAGPDDRIAADGEVQPASANSQPLQRAPEVSPLSPGMMTPDQNYPGSSQAGDGGGTSTSATTVDERSSYSVDQIPDEFIGTGNLPSGRPFVQLRGRLMADQMYSNQSAGNLATVGPIDSGFAWRQLRLGAQGGGYDNMIYQFEMEFSDQTLHVRSTFLGFTNLPFFGTLFLGFVKEPFSLEEMPNEMYQLFMERSVANAFVPGRSSGVKFLNQAFDERMTYSAGCFYDNTDHFGNAVDRGTARAVTGRATWLPFYDEASNGRYLWHVGGSFSARRPMDSTVSYKTTPDVDVFLQSDGTQGVPNFVDTHHFNTQGITLAGAETCLVYGPFFMQSEYIMTRCTQPAGVGPDYFFWGGYVEAAYMLTGENHIYDRQQGFISRQRPFERFFALDSRKDGRRLVFGKGAWEVAARIDHIDLNNQNITGGRLSDVTAGINWYMNDRSKMQFNYVHAMLNQSGVPSEANFFLTRYAVVF